MNNNQIITATALYDIHMSVITLQTTVQRSYKSQVYVHKNNTIYK